MKKNRSERITKILGVGLDNEDGHVRITQGRNFAIYLGSDNTHSRMQEICVRVNEKLDRKGRPLQSLSRDEFIDLISGC